ncbi:MAG: hypothetical protein RL199_1763, partial [Pseudomonadota bacterium]
MRTDAAPIIAVVDTGIIDGPNGLFTRDRFLSMGAVRVVAASAPLVGPEQLPAFFLSVRRMAGNGPLFVVTTRPEWAFGVLRLFHRLCDGVVLWGDARPPPAAESAPWGRLFATASRMEGSDAPDVGMRVLVRLELPTLGHLSEALLVGRRWRHWEPLGPRWPTAPAPRNAAPPEIFSMPSGGFLVSDASGLRMVAQAPKGSVGSFVGSAPTKPETGAGDGVAGRLLTAARLMFGDDGLLLAWRDRHTPTEYGTHLSIIGTLVARWRLILESERLLAAKDAAGFRALMDAAELDAWKAGVLGVSRLVGVACRPVDAAWFEACVGRVAVALTAGGDGTLPAPSEG